MMSADASTSDSVMMVVDGGEAKPPTQAETQATEAQPQPQEEIVLDSLPYIDYSHPDYEAYAASLIEQEMATFQPHPDTLSLKHLGPNILDKEPKFISASKFNAAEYAQLVQRGGGPRPEGEGYVPPADHTAPLPELSDEQLTDEAQLRSAIDRAKTTLEGQRSRMLNLELMSEFESDLWRHHNADIEKTTIQALNASLSEARGKVDEVNARRKTMQEEEAAPRLNRLGGRWEELVGNNLQLRDATRMLMEEVERMKTEAGVGEEEEKEKEGGAGGEESADTGEK